MDRTLGDRGNMRYHPTTKINDTQAFYDQFIHAQALHHQHANAPSAIARNHQQIEEALRKSLSSLVTDISNAISKIEYSASNHALTTMQTQAPLACAISAKNVFVATKHDMNITQDEQHSNHLGELQHLDKIFGCLGNLTEKQLGEGHSKAETASRCTPKLPKHTIIRNDTDATWRHKTCDAVLYGGGPIFIVSTQILLVLCVALFFAPRGLSRFDTFKWAVFLLADLFFLLDTLRKF